VDRRDWSGFPDPILVVEILSPSSARADRITKRRRFQRAGIPEYWVVDLDARTLERWRPDPYRVLLFHRGQLSDAERELIRPLDEQQDKALANLAVQTVDLADESTASATR